MPFAIELKSITKRFGSFVANEGVNLAVERGRIHAIIGENGAGKTTLMNVLFGLLQPDEGEIWIDGEKKILPNPAAAIAAGIGMVHQHFKLVPSLTVAENVFLGMEIRKGGLIDHKAQIERTASLSKQFGLQVDPSERVGLLSVGIEQRIEILKVLVRGARTIILDEPTAVLTPQESRELFQTLRGFVAQGMTVLFISHHLEEVMEVSDTVTVLRHGKEVATRPTAELTKSDLVQMMVGRFVSFDRRPRPPTSGKTVLEVEDLWCRDERRVQALRGVSFKVRAGEIVGIAGVAGNGQTELAEVLSGLRPSSHGAIRLQGRPITGLSARAIRAAGIAHVPGDRLVRGVDRNASIALNMLMGRQDQKPWSRSGIIDHRYLTEQTTALIKRFDIRARGPESPVKSLSGGNIQKVVLAREFSGDAGFLLIDQPTRGVDIGAQEAIHGEIMRQREAGKAILLISVQLDELSALADRILVMFNGTVMGELPGDRVDEEEIGMLMAGVRPGSGASARGAA
ncbi:ABC transporter ATP-binding protein [Kaistia dalseonensis]|uniref:Simple sugar transport system ATP-binding protein n=1 Tax=Kaistia dalseonensis TaxID=410840 RepID=A0ABU0HAP5_9HYPH|nr:ABC transporter ATP-binding protein [Kaistia dalseonensis]MCX5496756.1 ABC transporter ATP-binding protein [Kaistia dalseonensis]MDQ0439382.1 simple sugar transport system ATP-binding protein [Kaistia dalseonensis]